MLIDLELLWENVEESLVDALLEKACNSCEQGERACEDCEWVCDNDKNVVFRSHYYNSGDLV